uniref:Uncharacterized protein n=1 Tax=Oryza punctata TaxID=4537 RepID=A0A0E0KFI9_ORYPU
MERRLSGGGDRNGGERGAGDHGAGGGAERGTAARSAAGEGVLLWQPGSVAAATEAQQRVPSLAPAASGAIGGRATVMVARGHPNRRGIFLSWVSATLYWVWVWSGLQLVSASVCAILSWLVHPVVILWGWWRVLVVDEYADHLFEAVFLLIVLAPIVFISVLKTMLE